MINTISTTIKIYTTTLENFIYIIDTTMIRSNGVTESIRKEGRRMFCLAIIDVFSRVFLPHATCTHTHTHTYTRTHKRRGIDPRDEPRFLSRELEKNGHRPLTFLETGVAASFMRSPPFPFQPCVHTVTWLLYRRPHVHYRPPNEPLELVHLPSTRTH